MLSSSFRRLLPSSVAIGRQQLSGRNGIFEPTFSSRFHPHAAVAAASPVQRTHLTQTHRRDVDGFDQTFAELDLSDEELPLSLENQDRRIIDWDADSNAALWEDNTSSTSPLEEPKRKKTKKRVKPPQYYWTNSEITEAVLSQVPPNDEPNTNIVFNTGLPEWNNQFPLQLAAQRSSHSTILMGIGDHFFVETWRHRIAEQLESASNDGDNCVSRQPIAVYNSDLLQLMRPSVRHTALHRRQSTDQLRNVLPPAPVSPAPLSVVDEDFRRVTNYGSNEADGRVTCIGILPPNSSKCQAFLKVLLHGYISFYLGHDPSSLLRWAPIRWVTLMPAREAMLFDGYGLAAKDNFLAQQLQLCFEVTLHGVTHNSVMEATGGNYPLDDFEPQIQVESVMSDAMKRKLEKRAVSSDQGFLEERSLKSDELYLVSFESRRNVARLSDPSLRQSPAEDLAKFYFFHHFLTNSGRGHPKKGDRVGKALRVLYGSDADGAFESLPFDVMTRSVANQREKGLHEIIRLYRELRFAERLSVEIEKDVTSRDTADSLQSRFEQMFIKTFTVNK